MRFNLLFILCLFIVASACTSNPKEPEVDNNPKTEASELGMVAAAQPLATEAGKKILEMGGNAADAAIATGFVISIVEPTMNSIGGRSLVFLRTPDGKYQGYNGMTEIPASFVAPETPATKGHGTIAIPGVVANLIRLHKEHGSLPLETIMAPAIDIAENGFEVLPGEARRHKSGYNAYKDNPGFKAHMLKGDSITYTAGEILKQPALAQTLKRIAATGGKDFYEGETAKMIVADMEANGGFVSLEDLKNYRALDARYVTTNYRGYDIHTMPAPAGGGLIIKSLNILENFDMAAMTDAQWAAVVNQALSHALESMTYDYKEEDINFVQSREWAKEKASEIIIPSASEASLNDYTISDSKQLLASNTDWTGNTWGKESHHTTHFVTADCDGMVVSITQTVGPLFGSKVITEGLGFVYASTMGAYLSASDQSPGSRPRTTIAPTVVTKDGEVVMTLGAAGGLRILSGIVQVISRSIDRGMDLEQAVAAPRVHPNQGSMENGKRVYDRMKFSAEFTEENGWSVADSAFWANTGFTVQQINRYGAFSRVHAISRDTKTKVWTGMADLDWEGTADAPDDAKCNQ